MLCDASNTLVKSSDEVAAALGVISPLDQTQPLTKFTRCSELLYLRSSDQEIDGAGALNSFGYLIDFLV